MFVLEVLHNLFQSSDLPVPFILPVLSSKSYIVEPHFVPDFTASPVHTEIFTFSKQSFNEPLDFATVHRLMDGTNKIDSCQTHLPVHCALNIELIRQK